MPDASTPSSTELFALEDRFIQLYDLRKSAGFATDDIEEAYAAVSLEMYEHDLVAKGLPTKPAGKPSGKPVATADPVSRPSTGVPTPATAPAPAVDPAAVDPTLPAPGGAAPAPPVAKPPAPGAPDPASGDSEYTPHPFAPSDAIASICGTCGRPIADHVGKFIGSDDSWEYAAHVIKEYRNELTTTGKTDPSLNILLKRDFTGDERKQYAATGVSLPDGSFPIPDEASLHNAIRLVGHAADPQAAMQHIIERSKAMGMTHALPPAWNVADAGMEQPAPAAQGAHTMSPQAAGPAKPGAAGGAPKPAAPAGGSVMKAIAAAFQKGIDAGHTTDVILTTLDAATADTFEQYVVMKADEKRYTQGPVYMPEQYDAHGEWTTADELQKALWDYVRETGADRKVYLQHTARPAGEWVEAFQWHFPVKATMTKSIDGVAKAVAIDLPAGTTYLGVVWEPWAYEDVKKQKITGFSMGGWAKRLEIALGDK